MDSVASRPTLIERGRSRFLIMDAPRDANLHQYIRECKKANVTDVVRVCEATYDAKEIVAAGMTMHEFQFSDGDSPPSDIIDAWLAVTDRVFHSSRPDDPQRPCVAVHCVAGLGRAPVLVAIALIERERLDAIAAVELIRERRRGAINQKQLGYLESYQRRGSLRRCNCVVM
mmetsp:Transcript_7831/g.26640  ORF Transcript_7831/g.26640 Transcript_7831/m.26640 type:complete len:172 (+) Transcript_7831:264-779(+)